MTVCPCCSDQLLRHVRQSKIYWFCPNCRQEMPVADPEKKQDKSKGLYCCTF